MEIYTMNVTRPSMPLTAACAPSALRASALAERVSVQASVRPVAVLAAERAPATWAHQVQIQAELAPVLTLTGINGSTGFKGSDVSTKRYADGGSGVPPRGRPV